MHGIKNGWNPLRADSETRRTSHVPSDNTLYQVTDALSGGSPVVMNRSLGFNNHEHIAWVTIFNYFPNDRDTTYSPCRDARLNLEDGSIHWDGGGVDFARTYPDYISYMLGERNLNRPMSDQNREIDKLIEQVKKDTKCLEELKKSDLNAKVSITTEEAAIPIAKRGRPGPAATTTDH
jgi:hypothetical protein